MKKVTMKKRKLTKKEEDLIFVKRIEEAWKRYKKGEFIEMEADEFLEEIKKW